MSDFIPIIMLVFVPHTVIITVLLFGCRYCSHSYDTEILLTRNTVINASNVESNLTNLEANILSYTFSNNLLM